MPVWDSSGESRFKRQKIIRKGVLGADNWLSNRIFKSYDDLVDHCCEAWNKLVDEPWRIMSLGLRLWAHVRSPRGAVSSLRYCRTAAFRCKRACAEGTSITVSYESSGVWNRLTGVVQTGRPLKTQRFKPVWEIMIVERELAGEGGAPHQSIYSDFVPAGENLHVKRCRSTSMR